VGHPSSLQRRTDGAAACPAHSYVGRADLLDLAVATCLELRREQGEFDLLSHDEAEGIRGRLLLDRCDRLHFDLAAIWKAMDTPMPGESWATQLSSYHRRRNWLTEHDLIAPCGGARTNWSWIIATTHLCKRR
jgi:hypothetical protein